MSQPERKIYVPPEGPRPVAPPSPEIYAAMGEANIFAMLADFYAELEQSSIRSMFPPNMKKASEKSAAFFVGLLGGPPLYHQRYGPPMMRARHMPFIIDEAARQVWLACFDAVLAQAPERYGFPQEHLPGFRAFLDSFSAWMVNTKHDTGHDTGHDEENNRESTAGTDDLTLSAS
jgi:hemoglobin